MLNFNVQLVFALEYVCFSVWHTCSTTNTNLIRLLNTSADVANLTRKGFVFFSYLLLRIAV